MNGSDSPVQRLPSQNIITTSSGNIGSGFMIEKKKVLFLWVIIYAGITWQKIFKNM